MIHALLLLALLTPTFTAEKDEFAGKVLVCYSSKTCPICDHQKPVWDHLTKLGYNVKIVDIASPPKWLGEFKVKGGVPQTHYYIDRKATMIWVGFADEKSIIKIVGLPKEE
jgi:hypothetical protein